MNPPGERDRLADALTHVDSPEEGSCELDLDQIWAAAAGELEPEALSEVLEQVRRSAACAEAYQMAIAALAEEGDAEELPSPPPLEAPANRRPWLLPAVMLGAVAAAVSIALWPASDPGYRSGSGDAVELHLPEGAPITADTVLTWAPGESGSRYAVLLSTESLTTIAREEGLTTNRLEVDPAWLEGLPAGTRLRWQVMATAPDGTRTSSAPQHLVVE